MLQVHSLHPADAQKEHQQKLTEEITIIIIIIIIITIRIRITITITITTTTTIIRILSLPITDQQSEVYQLVCF